MSKITDVSYQNTDSSDDDSLIITNKKKLAIIDSSEDEEYGSANEISESSNEDKTVPIKKSPSSLVTSTPGNEEKERQGRQYFSTSIMQRQQDSDIISESDDEDKLEINESANFSQDLTFEASGSSKESFSTPNPKPFMSVDKRRSFITPQTKKIEIVDSDTDDSDVIDTSQIIDDSFDAERPMNKSVSHKTLDNDHVIISSDSDEPSEKTPQPQNKKVQAKLTDMMKNLTASSAQNDGVNLQKKIECKRSEYNRQVLEIKSKEVEMIKSQKLMSTVNLSSLPDKGLLLKTRFEAIKNKFLQAQITLKNMVVVEEDCDKNTSASKSPSSNWNDIEAGLAVVQPKTFGKKGLENYRTEKALTVESLEQLHGALKNCPKDGELADEPKGLKVSLMEHQRRALAWMVYREEQKPPGGILADDMGLGKTLTMISLVLKTKENEVEHEETDEDRESASKRHRKYNGGTLVVCPASLLNQWAQEIDTKLRRGMLSYNVYHGPKREDKPKRLAEHDVVITTYSIVMNEMDKEAPIFRVRWSRIILDEAHQIRNHKSQTSIACCALAGKHRWALTGTPVHNKELDMYALLKFLRCSPFDDLAVWKRWVGDKGSGGGERLNTVISSLMLRRTKAELVTQGKLNTLPPREWKLIPVNLDESEMSLYQKILLFSQTLFAQYLHQRAEKNQDIINFRNPNADTNSEYFKMRKKLLAYNRMSEVNQHEILVLLLRLRQICCHPSLIINMLQGDEDLGDEEPEEREELNLLEQLNKLNLEDDPEVPGMGPSVGVKEAAKGILNPSHPLFAKDRISSKVRTAMDLIPNILSTGDKMIIISQWTSFLELVGWQLKEAGIKFTQLDGKVPTAKRTELVTNFNDPNSRVKVLLLSLTAGGVGLNLVGANHLFLLDLHWNPQLENQAQDRIYRMGQKKNVYIYKFMATETIEERIKNLQENKIQIAETMLTGSKAAIGNKLSLQDLRSLFNM